MVFGVRMCLTLKARLWGIEGRFSASLMSRVNLDGVCFKSISRTDNGLLCDNITEVEVLEVVSQCGRSKCPGLDGFNFTFVKKYWEVIGKDVVELFSASRVLGLFREVVMLRS